MTAVRYTPDECVQIAQRWRDDLRPLMCPRHATPLEVIEVWAWRDVPGGVMEHSFPTPGNGAILAGWNVTRVQVQCAACGEGVQGIDVRALAESLDDDVVTPPAARQPWRRVPTDESRRERPRV
jgi:hypothetical protein